LALAALVQAAGAAPPEPQVAAPLEEPAEQPAPRPAEKPPEAAAEKPAETPDSEPEAEKKAPFVALIRLPLPITGNADNRIQGMIRRVRQRAEQHRGGERPILVLEFTPGGTEFGEGTDFTRALGLARFLASRELAGIRTVAYIPRTIKGHAVLVAMACEEIVMARDAELGDAGLDEPPQEPIEPAVASGYKQIAQRRRTIPVEVALGMLNKRLEVLKVETEVSVEYVLRQDLDELKKHHAVQSVETLIPQGELGRFTGAQGRALGFVKYLAADRQALARALDVPASELREDPSLGGDWKAVQVTISGPIDAQTASQTINMIGDALRRGEANMLLLRVDSSGGSLVDSMKLATFLADLDPGAIRTVAYVPNEARADAALVALAADQLVMGPDAELGGDEDHTIPPDEVDAARRSIRETLAKEKSRHWSLPAAFVDPKLEVHRYTHRKSGAVAYFSDLELKAQENADQWQQGPRVTRPGAVLHLTGAEAKDLGLASETVESFDELKQLYGLQNDPKLIEPNWADTLVEALARPELAALLLILGGVAVYAELHAPGVGVGGFIASVCFLLFFWSKFLHGTADWLEVMLFLAGLCSLLMEIFVIPGFGVFGLGGGLRIIASLVLASQHFVLPHNESELHELRNSLITVGAAVVGMMAVGIALRRYLPHAPFFNRMLLEPPQPDFQPAAAGGAARGYDYQHLLGRRGAAVTQLTPSGKARFDDELIDVIAPGEVIDRGAAVEVVQVRGTHVYVRSVGDK
jgi:membrane-bound ClpP family serine protease